MAFRFSKRSLAALATCHSVLQAIATRALGLSPVDFIVTEGHRGREAQEAAFAAGKSKAHFGKSFHNHEPSLALDVVPYPVDWSDSKKFKAIADAFKKAAKELGAVLRWGGDFKSFIDMPHFEIDEPIKKSIGEPMKTDAPSKKPATDSSIGTAFASRGDLMSLSPIQLLARVIWGECRGKTYEESLAIAFVVVNRANKPGWWGGDVKSVCMASKQFSCLNPGDPNLKKILAGDFRDGNWSNCVKAASDATLGLAADPTGGAIAYHATYIHKPTDFGNVKPTCTIGSHIFYRS